MHEPFHTLTDTQLAHMRKAFRLHNVVNYKMYLQTAHWRHVKLRFFRSRYYDGSCHCCGRKGKMEVHHKTYIRIGKERPSDLLALCRQCHERVHMDVWTNPRPGALATAHNRVRNKIREDEIQEEKERKLAEFRKARNLRKKLKKAKKRQNSIDNGWVPVGHSVKPRWEHK